MDNERIIRAVSAHADSLIGRPADPVHLTDEEYRHIAPLFQLTEQLHRTMTPSSPSASFVRNLGQELMEQAQRQMAWSQRMRRGMLIGAAALGSLLSVASVIGAIVFVVVRWRARDQTCALHATPG
ncbi:MAG TPA: hypothetical protein ENN99_09545 [Chloroflexi bacterium]|nr:hypothetical protein [Chloroflexota bacterium]